MRDTLLADQLCQLPRNTAACKSCLRLMDLRPALRDVKGTSAGTLNNLLVPGCGLASFSAKRPLPSLFNSRASESLAVYSPDGS